MVMEIGAKEQRTLNATAPPAFGKGRDIKKFLEAGRRFGNIILVILR